MTRPLPAGARTVAAARFLLAAAAGLCLLAAFPPWSMWWLAPVGVAALAVATFRQRAGRGALLGLVCGLALFVPLLSWVAVVGADAWWLLALSQAAFFAGLGAALALVTRLPGWPAWVATLWVLQEALRDRIPFGGFPWGRLAFGQDDGPVVRLAALGGAPLVSFAVALAGGLLAGATLRALRRDPRRGRGTRRVGTAAAALVGAAAALAAGLAVPVPTAGQRAGGPAYAQVALVQGNVPRLGLGEFDQVRAVIRDHAAVTEQLAREVAAGTRPRPDVVIWPENSSDLDPFVDAQANAIITRAVRAIDAPTLVGAVLDGVRPGTVRNTGLVWTPTGGPGAFYVKRHPVPFGEYVPFRSVLTRFIGRFALVPYDFAAGHRPGVLQLGPVRVGDVICFEVAYDDVTRDAVTHGGRIITVQTNNATFERRGESGRGGETAQQLAISRLRAVEHGRAVLVAATSGVSAVIAPNGRVLQRSGIFVPDVLSARVPLRDSLTLADRLGAVPEWVLALIGAATLAVAVVRRRRLAPPAGVPTEASVAARDDRITAGGRA